MVNILPPKHWEWLKHHDFSAWKRCSKKDPVFDVEVEILDISPNFSTDVIPIIL